MARLLIGTSGYVYPHWRGRFYPQDLPQAAWLPFYAERFSTVELNNPFYRLPEAATFRRWREAVPRGFVFAVKASRFITHVKRLRDPAGPVDLLFSRAKELGPALGPVLFQLPPRWKAVPERLDELIEAIRQQKWVRRSRIVLEVRDPSWLDQAVTDRLEAGGIALCLADWPECPVEGPVPAGFVYVRRHGTGVHYGGSYTEAMLREDAKRIRGWLKEGDVYAYFNNDAEAHAVRNALRLLELVERNPRRNSTL